MNAPGQKMKVPYSISGKMAAFPWSHHMKSRGFKMIAVGFVASHYVFYQLHKAVNSPANVNMWKKVRDDRKR